MTEFEKPTRYLGQTSAHLEKYKRTAELYTWLLTNQESLGLFTKPFDRSKGHRSSSFLCFKSLICCEFLILKPDRAYLRSAQARVGDRNIGRAWLRC